VAQVIGSPQPNTVAGPPAHKHGANTVGFRPEHIAISTTEGEYQGKVGVAEHLGSDTFVHVHTEALGTVNVRADGEIPVHHGDTVWLTPDPAKIHRFGEDGLAL
jgi:multiple sugar transport system ATP-binding protein